MSRLGIFELELTAANMKRSVLPLRFVAILRLYTYIAISNSIALFRFPICLCNAQQYDCLIHRILASANSIQVNHDTSSNNSARHEKHLSLYKHIHCIYYSPLLFSLYISSLVNTYTLPFPSPPLALSHPHLRQTHKQAQHLRIIRGSQPSKRIPTFSSKEAGRTTSRIVSDSDIMQDRIVRIKHRIHKPDRLLASLDALLVDAVEHGGKDGCRG